LGFAKNVVEGQSQTDFFAPHISIPMRYLQRDIFLNIMLKGLNISGKDGGC